jgi:hypothetical protein
VSHIKTLDLSHEAAGSDMAVIAIDVGFNDSIEAIRDYRKLTLDESGAEFRTFRVNDVPTILVADAQGRIVRRVDGGASKDAAALLNTVVGL